MKSFFVTLLLMNGILWADSYPNMGPDPYDTVGGMISPTLSQASAESSHWIALVDQAQYGASWQDAGPLLRDIITQDQWVAGLTGTRHQLGLVRARRLSRGQAVSSLPNGTLGTFVVLKYDTSFSARPSLIETVVLMLIQHDQWRVISYSIK